MQNANYCNYTMYEVAVMSGFNGNPSDWMAYTEAYNFIDSTPTAIQHIRRILMDSLFNLSEFQTRLISKIDEEFSIIKYEYDRERRTYSFKIKKTVAKKKKGYAPDTLFFRGILANILSSLLAEYQHDMNIIFLNNEIVRKYYIINGSGNFNMFCTLTAAKLLDPNVCQSLFDIYVTGENSFSLII